MPTHKDIPARRLRDTYFREKYRHRGAGRKRKGTARRIIYEEGEGSGFRSRIIRERRLVPWAMLAGVLISGIIIGAEFDRAVSLDAFNGVVRTVAERGVDWFSWLQDHLIDVIDDAKGDSNGLIHGCADSSVWYGTGKGRL